MRPASVGFQCPECVREGARSTRAARTAYGGQRTANPALTSQVIIGINVLVWVLIVATGGARSRLLAELSLTPLQGVFRTTGGLLQLVDGVAHGAPWQLLTSVFTHQALTHIGFNMLALWVLGPQLEMAVGRIRFVAIYLVSGLAGSATVLWFSPVHQTTLGASWAIFGVMGALLVIAIKVHGDVRGLATWIGVNLVITVLIPNISWQGHLGGLVGGVLLGGAIAYAPRRSRSAWQAAGVGATVLLVGVASALRIAQLA
jgi:membrane associated rhomboid family serine protease